MRPVTDLTNAHAIWPLQKLVIVTKPFPSVADAQHGGVRNGQGVPHFVKFNAALKTVAGVPRTGTVAIKFVIYGDAAGGTPLWQEVQNSQLDQQGRYEVMLGATASEGIPMELFTSGEPRWLEVQALCQRATVK